MPGPIIRSGPNSQYAKNWEAIFGNKQRKMASKTEKPAAKKASPKKKRS